MTTKRTGHSALKIVQKYHPEVEEVVDATKAVTINVTSADCKAGEMKDPSACALAHAACRTYDGAIISLSVAYLIRGKRATRYRVPGYTSRELVAFDRNNRFEPGKYTLLPVSPWHLLGRIVTPGKKVKYPKKRAQAHYTVGVRAL